MKKLQEIVTNPLQNNPFLSRPTGGGSRRHDRDRNERNVARRLEQALEVVSITKPSFLPPIQRGLSGTDEVQETAK